MRLFVKILFFIVFVVFHQFSFSQNVNFVECNKDSHFSNSCNVCGYVNYYKGVKYYLPDRYIRNGGDTHSYVISSVHSSSTLYSLNSNVSITGGCLNIINDSDCRLTANYIPSDRGTNTKPLYVFTYPNIVWDGNLDISEKNNPIGMVEFNLAKYIYYSNAYGNATGVNYGHIYMTGYKKNTTTNKVDYFFSTGNYDIHGYVNLDESESANFYHKECYLVFPSRCGDGVIQSDEGEHCDNGTGNWDGTGDPIVKNGVVCNTSCQVVQPTCGSAAKTYPVSATSYGSDTFCGQYSILSGSNPAFPVKGGSSSWTCKLGDQTVSCSANRNNDTTPPTGGGGGGRPGGGGSVSCGTTNGKTLNAEPTTNLCSDGSTPPVSDVGTGWIRTCGTDSCSANKSACAIAGTCSVGACGSLASTILNGSSKINELKDPYNFAYHNDFCTNGAILSPQYDPSITSKQFKWYCGTTLCSANIQFNKGVIKIYGAYSGASIWACPECNGFDEETWNGIKHKFLSDFDTQYTRSIMSGDYLPFGRILPEYKKYVNSCNSTNVGKWQKSSVKVDFKAINGDGTVVYSTPVLSGFGGSLPSFHDNSVVGESYIPASQTHKFSMGENSIKGYIINREKCESYTVVVNDSPAPDGTPRSHTEIRYRWAGDISLPTEFASQTFTVTDSYILQIGTSFSNVSNVNLNFNGKGLNYYGISPVNTINNYDTGALLKVLGNFIGRYKQYALLPDQHLFGDTTVDYKKILTKEVYYVGNENIVIHGEVTQPTTILVESGNVTINGNITGPLMLVVKNGKIIFQNANMNKQTILDGYYITDKGFKVEGPAVTHNIILNDNSSSSRWYADGRLKIKGVLIGPNSDEIYKKRRSVLKNYFRNGFGPAWAIKHGASLTITSNPNLWLNAPVGSKDLFGMLKVSKGY